MEAQTKLNMVLFKPQPRKVKMAINPDTWDDYEKLINDTKYSVYVWDIPLQTGSQKIPCKGISHWQDIAKHCPLK